MDILHYEISGNGPPIVLLHGYLSSLRYWDAIRVQLATDYTVITVDLLGFGDSPKPDKNGYTYEEHLDWIKRTLEHVGINCPMLVAGHSMGSLLGLRLAAEEPTLVSDLVLINPPVFNDAAEARQELSRNPLIRISLYWRLHRLVCPVMRTKPMQFLMRQAVPPIFRGMETYAFCSTAISRFRSLCRVIEEQHFLDDLARTVITPIVIQGKGERLMYQRNLSRISQESDFKLVLTNTAHHTLLEDPHVVVETIRKTAISVI